MTSYGLEILAAEECETLLAHQLVGRVAICTGRPAILPVLFALDDGDIVFRTAPGEKLIAAALHRTVVFEVDNFNVATREGWSVDVVGTAEEIVRPKSSDGRKSSILRRGSPARSVIGSSGSTERRSAGGGSVLAPSSDRRTSSLRPLRLVCARPAGGVELYDHAVWIGNRHEPPQVALGRCRVSDARGVELQAPSAEILNASDVERDATEAPQCAGGLRLMVQPKTETAHVIQDDAHHSLFFFETQARLEAEHLGIPVSAAHHV